MALKLHRLTARTVESLKRAGRHADGGGLYLSIGKAGGRRWVFLFKWKGRPVEMGLGSASAVPLVRARERAAEARAHLAEHRNPLAEKRRQATAQAEPTFGELADQLIEAMSPTWKNPKHRDQWVSTLSGHAGSLRPKLVSEITTDDVLGVLRPIWTTRPETASRLRGRIEAVLAAATARGFRSGANPAQWRHHLATILPRRSNASRGHFAALPYADVAAFMEALRARDDISARALELVILTAARTSELRLAQWREFDLDAKLWIVPADRMKAGREHRVPLSTDAVAVLTGLQRGEDDALIVEGRRAGRPISDMTLLKLLGRMGFGSFTVHGFRSTFKDWSRECTNFANEISEAALAHVIRDKTEAAYARSDLFKKRRTMMEAWAAFARPRENVVRLPGRAGRAG
ncbi:MAG: integrase arm-type DNA-binding domain-containing protein [Pseudolabrys sp.]|jgi:integrase